MSFWAKVFTVLIFVLALVFASITAVLYTQRMDYHQTLRDVRDSLQARIDALDQGVSRRDRDLARLREDFATQREELQKTRNQLELEEGKTAQLQAQGDRLERDRIRLEASNTSLQEMLKQADARRSQVETELATRVRELSEKRQDLASARDEIQNLTTRLGETEQERDELAFNLKAAQDRLEAHEQKFAELRRIYFADERLVSILDRVEPVLADIRGRVLSVDRFGNVVINVGKDDNVMRDYVFTVYRDDMYIAQIRIFELDESGDLSAGTVVNMNEKGYPIKQGDSVATRLMP